MSHAPNKKVTWPSSLKTGLKIHMKTIQTERKMPVIEENPPNSVLAIITKVIEAMPRLDPSFFAPPTAPAAIVVKSEAEEGSTTGSSNIIGSSSISTNPFPQETLATVSDFLLDLFEQCCQCNLLTVDERRTFQLIVLGKQSQLNNSRQQKKRRIEDVSSVPVQQRLTYASVLTVEYLLRLIASLPILVHHYQVLCSGINTMSHPINHRGGGGGGSDSASSSPATNTPSDGCEALWSFANATLKYVEQNPTVMTPLSRYAAFVDE